MRKNKIQQHSNTGNYAFTLKEITIYIVVFFTITFLTAVLYTQNQQIQELLRHIESLQTQIHSLNHNFTVLVNEKNAEIIALKESIQNINVTANSFDPEIIGTQTERRELHIKTSLIVLGSITVISLGYLIINGFFFGLPLKAYLPKVLLFYGKQLGFFTKIDFDDTYIKEYKGTLWKVKVIDLGKDMKISVKIKGDYKNAMELFDYHLSTGKPYTNTSPSTDDFTSFDNIFPSTADFTSLDSIFPITDDFTSLDNNISFTKNNLSYPLNESLNLVSTSVNNIITTPSVSATVELMSMLPNL